MQEKAGCSGKSLFFIFCGFRVFFVCCFFIVVVVWGFFWWGEVLGFLRGFYHR